MRTRRARAEKQCQWSSNDFLFVQFSCFNLFNLGEIRAALRPMNSPTQILLAVSFSLISQPASALRAEAPIPVTVDQLLAKGPEFDGKQVSVMGYYINSWKEGSCLFIDARAAKNSQPYRQSIWVDETTFNPGNPPSPPIGISELCELGKHYVRIVGHFHYRGANRSGFFRDVRFNRGFGLGGLWPSEITNIMNLRVAFKSSDDPINPCGMYHHK